MEKEKQQRTVIHLQTPNDEHYYFGNAKAMCDYIPLETLGATYNYIRNTLITENFMQTKTGCKIRKSILITSSKSSQK